MIAGNGNLRNAAATELTSPDSSLHVQLRTGLRFGARPAQGQGAHELGERARGRGFDSRQRRLFS